VEQRTSSTSLLYKFAKSIIRPESYQLFTSSLIILPLLIIMPQLRSSFFEVVAHLKNIIKKKIQKNFMSFNAYALMIVFFGATSWFITFSDKNYHLLILLIPLLFFYLINLRAFSLGQCGFIVLVAIYCLLIILYLPILKLNKDPECLYTPFCDSSPVKSYADSANFLRDLPHKEVTIVGGRGWTYFYSDKKPSRSINDWWLYFLDDSYATSQLIKQHQNLLKMPSRQRFLIDNILLDINNKNQLLEEVLLKSELVKRQSKYSVFQIR
jgi:hypothetical protein